MGPAASPASAPPSEPGLSLSAPEKPDGSGRSAATRAYYDAFAEGYEAQRGPSDPGGYHDLLDELEAGFVQRFGSGKQILEVGCGTGLVLERLGRFAQRAQGVDLSPGMLEKARARGLDVTEGSVTALPFPDHQFDVTCAFKVLAHVPELPQALAEMARVTRPGGVVIAEFYNPYSLRGLLRRWGPRGWVAPAVHEGQVYTRFDSPFDVRRHTPAHCTWLDARGIRIVTPAAWALRTRLSRRLFRSLEHQLCDSPLKYAGGFFAVAFQKRSK